MLKSLIIDQVVLQQIIPALVQYFVLKKLKSKVRVYDLDHIGIHDHQLRDAPEDLVVRMAQQILNRDLT